MRKSILLNISSKVYSIGLGYLAIVLMTNTFERTDVGIYLFFISLITIFERFVNFGLSKNIIYQESELSISSNQVLRNLIFLLTNFFALIVAFVLWLFINPYEIGFLSFFVCIASISFRSFLSSFLLIKGAYNHFNFVSNLLQVSILAVAFLALFIYEKSTFSIIEVYAGVELVVLFINLVLAVFLRILRFNFSNIAIHLQAIRKLLFTSWPYFILDSIQISSKEIDKILVSMYLNPAALATYGVADKLSRLSLVGFNAVAPLLQRQISANKNDKLRLKQLYDNYTSFIIACSIPISFVLITYGSEISLLFGKEYQDIIVLLLILIPARLFQYFTGFKAVLLQMTGLRKYEIFNNLLKVFAIVGSFLLLVPFLGVNGMAVSVSIGLLLIAGLQKFQVWKSFNVNIFYSEMLLVFPYTLLFLLKESMRWELTIGLSSLLVVFSFFQVFQSLKNKIIEY